MLEGYSFSERSSLSSLKMVRDRSSVFYPLWTTIHLGIFGQAEAEHSILLLDCPQTDLRLPALPLLRECVMVLIALV
jgi:hypothetical protein